MVSVFGFSSSLIGGYLSDKYEKEGILMTKSYLCLGSAISGCVFFTLAVTIQSNFYVSMAM